MKIFNYLIIFICIISPVKADLNQNIISELKKGGKIIFIRHAYAPGGGDPNNFDINDCDTQRNLNDEGRLQSKKIGDFFKKNEISIEKVYSSEWCRCKETASIAFRSFETKHFLNSFFSELFVTHYVVISEILNYTPASGEIIVSDKQLKVIDTLEIEY
jgi:broad specificity phosphatase PhoE